MSAGANCKFHGLFGSFAEITAQVRAGTQHPPEVGDTARFRLADGTLGECSFGPSGWRTDKVVTPSGDVQFGGAVVASGFSSCAVTLNATGSATANFTAIQAALDRGGNVRIDGTGVLYISGTLVIGNGGPTRLVVSDNLTIRATTGRSLIVNKAFSNAAKAVSAATYASNVISVACTAHGFVVGQYVSIQGETTGGYNGPAEVLTTPNADSFTLRSNIQSMAMTATGTLTATLCDSWISIHGGIWDRAGIVGISALEKMAIKLVNIRDMDAGSMTIMGSDKYALLAGNYWRATTQKIELQTNSDGLHFQGPAAITHVTDITGTTGDNMVAFTVGDYAAYEVSIGDFDVIKVANVRGIVKNNFDLIRLVGKPNYYFRNVDISGIVQGGYPIVSLQTDTNLTQTNVKKMVLRDCEQRGAGRMIQILKSASGPCVVDEITINCRGESMSGSIVYINDGNTIGSVSVNGVYTYVAGAYPAYLRSAQRKMEMRGIHTGVATVDLITAEAASDIVDVVLDVYADTLRSLLTVMASGSAQNIHLPRVRAAALNRGLEIKTPSNVFIGDVVGTGATYELIRNSAAASVTTIYAIGRLVWNVATLYLTTGATARVNGLGAPVDASIVTVRTTGDVLHNSNAALGCGVGPAMWTGTAWQNLATGALYTP